MFRPSKVLAGMLVATFALAVFPLAGWVGSSGYMTHGAACHHFPMSPTPGHSHQCCVSGQQWAIPGSPVLRPVVVKVATDQEGRDLQPILFPSHRSAFLSVSPPALTSLRI